MTLQEAIVARHSVRQYMEKPIEAEKIEELKALIDECNREGGTHLQLVTDEPKAFAGGMAKYGKFRKEIIPAGWKWKVKTRWRNWAMQSTI